MPPLTIDALIEKTMAKLNADELGHQVVRRLESGARDAVAIIIGASLEVMDFQINQQTGEIVDPRPVAPPVPLGQPRVRRRR